MRDEEELELALEQRDPEIFLLAASERTTTPTRSTRCSSCCPTCRPASSRSPSVDVESRDEVLALERAGIDAVLVGVGRIAHLVGHQPFEV